ncbi:hypothetical protein [Saccharothrix longispora]|uniref:hypothetical protein n=1 Tax=Saccharothrix longispora TaxID=33920 RepID=UPI0028FD85A9|nr:hypothetical protein [Saccharothrix longispora]MDU0294639.1 hypothetical protein [Saccharothrix longispora]
MITRLSQCRRGAVTRVSERGGNGRSGGSGCTMSTSWVVGYPITAAFRHPGDGTAPALRQAGDHGVTTG